jgi:hypothetical protein
MGRLKFIGRPTYDRRKKIVAEQPEPLETLRDGRTVITLPPADVQVRKRIFEHEHAGRIVRLRPDLYKRVNGRLNLERNDAAERPADSQN